MTYLEFITDGDNVQAQSPLDGALVPNSSDAMGGADKEGSSSKRPGDETGVNWITYTPSTFLLSLIHVSLSSSRMYTHTHTHCI